MPSGGLVAMGNVIAFARDLAAGFAGLWAAQRRFLRDAHAAYRAVVAVGDVYGLLMAVRTRRPAVFVGTAKSVYVAPYGPFERRALRRAARVFVRDAATAARLRHDGVAADAPGNVIVDLAQSDERFAWRAATRIAVLPGSRAPLAYANAARLAAIVARVAATRELDVAVSIAPGIDASRTMQPFADRVAARVWSGALGALFAEATLALGQAGTANEAAAAAGLPVVALGDPRGGEDWYRMRQRRLLGDALAVLPPDEAQAASALERLLDDPALRSAMGRIGRERMGGAGGAAAIAREIAALATETR